MEEKQSVLAGDIETLKSVIQTVEARDALKETLNLLAGEKKKAEVEWNRLQDAVDEEVKREVETAKQVATAEEDKILKEQEKKRKEINHKREKVKNQGIRSRMEQETKDYVEINRECDKKIRKILKDNDFPLVCNSKAYFIMYSPESIKEWVIRVAVLLLLLVALPGLIIWIKNPFWLWKILIWIVFDFMVLAIYITIYLLSKDKDVGDLEQIRELRERISENNRKIRKIKRDIKEDTDESGYGLDSFDEELKQVEEEISRTQEQKEEKLKKFQETTAEVVVQQVKKSHEEAVENVQEKLNKISKEYDDVNIQLAEKNAYITDSYEKEIESSLLDAEKLKKVLSRMELEGIATVGEALQREGK